MNLLTIKNYFRILFRNNQEGGYIAAIVVIIILLGVLLSGGLSTSNGSPSSTTGHVIASTINKKDNSLQLNSLILISDTPTPSIIPIITDTPTPTIPFSGPTPSPSSTPIGTSGNFTDIKTVFIVIFENHNWSDVKSNAPYIKNTLLTIGAHAEQYYNPPGIHPSEPNYIWLEAGTNFGIKDDNYPSVNHQSTKNHLVTLLTNAGISWKAYEENISGTDCPLVSAGQYAVKHDPVVFFDDVTNTNSSSSPNCISHVRPYTEFANDLTSNTVAGYNFITPNICNDMHDCSVATGDTWLSHEIPKIISSSAYKNNGAIFITWDEGEGGDGPIGMIALSPLIKPGFTSNTHYTHSSTLRTVQEIFNVTPLLGDAKNASDLGDMFNLP